MGASMSQGGQRGGFRDQYRLGKKLGEGAFGVVHECRKRGGDDRCFAVKMIDRVEADCSDIEREVRLLHQLDHVNIVKCLDIFVEKCFVCIVMEKYGGGDLVDGLQGHLRSKGKIPEATVCHILKQLFTAVEHCHARSIIHRDIKGDNVLMDRPDLSDPNCHVVLSDFGTAIKHEQGKVLRQLTGTRVFWSPEMCLRRYSYPADLWASGVVLYGLIDATFPFRDEKQIQEKEVRIPAKITESCKDLIGGLLQKDPEKRYGVEKVLSHPWMKGEAKMSKKEVKEETKKDEDTNGASHRSLDKDIAALDKESVPQAMALRRRELAQNLNDKDAAKANNMGGEGEFSVEGLRVGEDIKFKWFDAKEAEKQVAVVGIQAAKHKQFQWTTAALKTQLERNGIDTAKWGTAMNDEGHNSKTLKELCQELKEGVCSLMHDCTAEISEKKLVRVVDVVLLRIKIGKEGDHILVESKEKYADGREHETWRLPGAKQRPNENVKGTAERIVSTLLHIEKGKISFNFQDKELVEEKEDSPSYPGVTTVYRKHIVEGNVLIPFLEKSALAAIGWPNLSSFSTAGKKKEIRTWTWMTNEEIEAKGVKVSGVSGEVSPYVCAPVNYDVDALQKQLEEGGVDTTQFGMDDAKTLYEFAQEMSRGESHLTTDDETNVLIRVVDVVVLKIHNPSTNTILLETERSVTRGGNTSKAPKVQLPGGKSRPNENVFNTARRICTVLLGFKEDALAFADQPCLIEEDKQSPSYPGLRTVYRKHIIDARIVTGN